MKNLCKKGLVGLSILLLTFGGATMDSYGAKPNKPKKTTSLEGEKVRVTEEEVSGYDMSKSLSADGMSLVEVAYKWFSGYAELDDKQMAIELAQRNAYATISRTLNNAVSDTADRNDIGVNEHVKRSLKAHWEQVSSSLIKGCEPYGKVHIEYDPSTKLYNVLAKVAIRGDRFNQLLKTAGSFEPDDLSGDDLESFIKANQAITEAARGN